jgi:protein gp37
MTVPRTGIEWTERTWNPVTGCVKVSPGCDNCYAETIATRFAGTKAFPSGFKVTLHPERLGQPLRWRKPAVVFVNSMADLFEASVPDEFIARVWAVMASTPAVRFLSCEPLLGPIDLFGKVDAYGGRRRLTYWMPPGRPLLGPKHTQDVDGGEAPTIDWVIAGGESGPKARPPHLAWFRLLRDQCAASGTPFFLKQWGEWSPRSHVDEQGRYVHRRQVLVALDGTVYEPAKLTGWDVPGSAAAVLYEEERLTCMYRVGKKHAGRDLDGCVHDAMPDTGPKPLARQP